MKRRACRYWTEDQKREILKQYKKSDNKRKQEIRQSYGVSTVMLSSWFREFKRAAMTNSFLETPNSNGKENSSLVVARVRDESAMSTKELIEENRKLREALGNMLVQKLISKTVGLSA